MTSPFNSVTMASYRTFAVLTGLFGVFFAANTLTGVGRADASRHGLQIGVFLGLSLLGFFLAGLFTWAYFLVGRNLDRPIEYWREFEGTYHRRFFTAVYGGAIFGPALAAVFWLYQEPLVAGAILAPAGACVFMAGLKLCGQITPV